MDSNKRPRLKLIGEDGNAFYILGRAMRAAKAAGWTLEQWDEVRRRAMASDYDHLLAVIQEYFDVY